MLIFHEIFGSGVWRWLFIPHPWFWSQMSPSLLREMERMGTSTHWGKSNFFFYTKEFTYFANWVSGHVSWMLVFLICWEMDRKHRGRETCFPFENTIKTTPPPFCKCATNRHTHIFVLVMDCVEKLPSSGFGCVSFSYPCSDRGINEENTSKNTFPGRKHVENTLDQDALFPAAQAPCAVSLPVTVVHSGCPGKSNVVFGMMARLQTSPLHSCPSSHQWRI